MDTEIERNAAIIEQAMRWGIRRGLFFGIILGVLIGGLGGYIVADLTIQRTVIVPLGPGTDV